MIRRLFLIASLITLCFITPHKAFGALAATTVWEVRGTGSANNGGGYSSGGTDYSQQDAAELSPTDLACLDTSTTLTSAVGGFTAAMIGNIIKITAGTNFTVGYYQITARTDANTVTIDRTAAAAGTNATGGTGYVGGASDHPNTISAKVVAGNKIWIKSGTYVKVGANAYVLTATVAGTITTPVIWIGYNSSRGDNPVDTTRPYFDGNSDTANCIYVNAAAFNIFRYLRVANATSDGIYTANGVNPTHFQFVKSSNNGARGLNFVANGTGQRNNSYSCEYNNNTGVGLGSSSGNGYQHEVMFSYVHDNAGGINLHNYANDSTRILYNIIESNTGSAITSITGVSQIIGNVVWNNTGAATDGIVFALTNTDGGSTSKRVLTINNSSSANGRYGFNCDAAMSGYPFCLFNFNNYNGNGTAGLNNITAGANDNTNAPAFTDAAGGDFTVTAADTALLLTGFSQTMPGAVGTYKWNIGVDQDDVTAAGGGGSTMGYGYSN